MQVTDQLQRIVTVPEHPKRIVSLVPSQTELLCSLGLENNLAGITKFCIHPNHVFEVKTKVGGTKNINHETIRSISPDLIIANKEENRPEDIALLERSFPVWVSDVTDLNSALEMIQSVGLITGKIQEAANLSDRILAGFSKLQPSRPARVLYLIWNQPFMTIGSDTFIHDMITRCGWANVFAASSRYPVITDEDIRHSNADIILLSSEPYPFRQQHADTLSEKFQIPAMLVDGEYFSWYGSKMVTTPDYLVQLKQLVAEQIRSKTINSR